MLFCLCVGQMEEESRKTSNFNKTNPSWLLYWFKEKPKIQSKYRRERPVLKIINDSVQNSRRSSDHHPLAPTNPTGSHHHGDSYLRHHRLASTTWYIFSNPEAGTWCSPSSLTTGQASTVLHKNTYSQSFRNWNMGEPCNRSQQFALFSTF